MPARLASLVILIVLGQLLVDQLRRRFNIARTSRVLPGLNDAARALSIDYVEIAERLLILLGRTKHRVLPTTVKMEESLREYRPFETGTLAQHGDACITSLVESEIDNTRLQTRHLNK